MNHDWSTGEISTKELDEEIAKMIALEAGYEEVKKIANDRLEMYEQQRNKVLSMLQAAGKSSYKVDGLGTCSQVIKYSITTPKDYESKKQMISHFEEMGDAKYGFLTVNYQTLNAYMNDMCQTDPTFTIPGVGERKETAELRFRKETRSKE